MADGVERVIRNEGVDISEQGEVDTTPLSSSEAGLGAPPLQGGELTENSEQGIGNSQPPTDNRQQSTDI